MWISASIRVEEHIHAIACSSVYTSMPYHLSLYNCAPDGQCSAEKDPQLCFCHYWGSGEKLSGSAFCLPGSVFSIFAILLIHCISKTWPGSQGEINSSPFSACQTTPGVLCPFWGLPSMRKKPLQPGTSPEESTHNGLGAGT